SFNTGTWNYSGNSNPPLFDEETLAARIQKRMIGYAEKLQILLNDTDHGLSDEAQALVSEVLTMFLSDERPEIDVVFDDLR
ncbi:hypothetical protein KJ708_09225, partial [bacterium]|nr:hypothetical protein [bacterium]